jgi:putative oxidoreductase
MRQDDWKDYVLSVLRIVIAFTFALHGCQKLFGMFGGMGGHGATAHMWSRLWVAAVLEVFGGGLIFLGLFTRPVALLLCGEMAVAYFTAHFPHGFWPNQNGGELAVLYCFIFLYLAAAGGGPIGLDQAIQRRK